MDAHREVRWPLLAYIGIVLFAGFNPIGIHYTVLELPPFWGAFLRFAPAALILFGIVLIRRLPLPRGRALWGAVLFGALNTGLSFVFLYYGFKRVQPGMATVLLALVPLFTLLFAILHRQETFRWRTLLGAVISLGGILIVFQEQLHANVPLVSMLAVILGSACLAEAAVIARKFPKNHPVTTSAIGMAVGAAIQLAVSLVFNEKWILPTKPATWAALAYLILIGACVVFILVLYTLKHWPASTVSYQFVLIPFVTVTASTFLAQEAINPILLVGALFVITGVFIGVIYTPRKRPVEVEACVACD